MVAGKNAPQQQVIAHGHDHDGQGQETGVVQIQQDSDHTETQQPQGAGVGDLVVQFRRQFSFSSVFDMIRQ